MNTIRRATPAQAERLFEIMVRATEISCAQAYPPGIIAIWHKGRSAAGMAAVIAEGDIHALWAGGSIRGFVHIDGAEIAALFVDPADQRQGFGSQLFCFARDRIEVRPIVLKATLNAVPFYARLGCREVTAASVRRHGEDIAVVRMELA